MSKARLQNAWTDPRTGRDYQSPILGEMHRAVANLDQIGLVDSETMRRFDRACLTPIEEMSAADIKALREKSGVSQAVFAVHLNASPKTVEAWERGSKKPSGPTLKLLTLAREKGLEYVR